MKIKQLTTELKKELDKITLVELATDKFGIQEDLTKIATTIQDFLMLINNRNRHLNLKINDK